jgi:ribonuclease D
MSQIVVVDELETLERVVEALSKFERVCLDTEVNAMYAYRPRVCLVQLCAATEQTPAEEVFVIDTLKIGTLAPLQPLLGTGHTTPIVHDIAYDARMLFAEGMQLTRAIDTALHARFLGLASTGLAHLLSDRFGVLTDKEFQRADWGKRPLSDEQLRYVSLDVAYLGAIARDLEAQAQHAQIAEEIAEETAWALRSAMQAPDTLAPPPYATLKGTRDLPPESRAILRLLWERRDRFAVERDCPPGMILGGQLLVQLARVRPRDRASFLGLTAQQGRALSDAMIEQFVACMAEGERAGDVPESERGYFLITKSATGEVAKRRAREERLTAWREAKALERSVNLQVILPGHVLAELAKRAPQDEASLAAIDGFGAARVARYSAELLSILRDTPVVGGDGAAAESPADESAQPVQVDASTGEIAAKDQVTVEPPAGDSAV